MTSSGARNAEVLNPVQFQSVIILGFSIAFTTIGGISLRFTNDLPDWNNNAWFQLHIGAFVFGGTLLATSLVFQYIRYKVAKDNTFDIKSGIQWIRLFLFLGFISWLICVVVLGFFIQESQILENCNKSDTTTRQYNSTNSTKCFMNYEKVLGIYAVDIIVLVLSLLLVIGEVFTQRSKITLLLSVFKETCQKDVAESVAFKGFLFIVYGVTCISNGFAAYALFNEENMKGSTVYVALLVTAMCVSGATMFLCGLLFLYISHAAKTKRLQFITELVNKSLFILFVALAPIGLNAISLVVFRVGHSEFGRCDSQYSIYKFSTAPSPKCSEHSELQGATMGCMAAAVFSFFFLAIFSNNYENLFQELYIKVENKNKTKAQSNKSKSTTPKTAASKAAKNITDSETTANNPAKKLKTTTLPNNSTDAIKSTTATSNNIAKTGKLINVKRVEDESTEVNTANVSSTKSSNIPNTNVSSVTVFARLEVLDEQTQTQNNSPGTTQGLLERQNRILMEQNQILFQQLLQANASPFNIQRNHLYNIPDSERRVFPMPVLPLAPRCNDASTTLLEPNVPSVVTHVDRSNTSEPPNYDDLFCVSENKEKKEKSESN